LKHRSSVVLTGAFAGGLLAVVTTALFAGRFALGSVGLSAGGDGQLVVRAGALYLATVVASLIGGAAVAVLAYGATADDDSEATRFELAHVLPFGLVAAVAAGYSVVRAALGVWADIATGEVTVTIAALGFAALLAGLVAGAITAWLVSTLAAKRIVGLEGEAAPASTALMMRAALQAVTGPLIAIVVIAAIAIGLSQLLLAAKGNAAIAIFGGAAAIVLFGAAAAAYLGGDKSAAK
jgi:hypothetical protein